MNEEDLARDLQKTVDALRDRGMEMANRPDLDAYADAIDAWHLGAGRGVPLLAFLGLGEVEYAAMVEGGDGEASEPPYWEVEDEEDDDRDAGVVEAATR